MTKEENHDGSKKGRVDVHAGKLMMAKLRAQVVMTALMCDQRSVKSDLHDDKAPQWND